MIERNYYTMNKKKSNLCNKHQTLGALNYNIYTQGVKIAWIKNQSKINILMPLFLMKYLNYVPLLTNSKTSYKRKIFFKVSS